MPDLRLFWDHKESQR